MVGRYDGQKRILSFLKSLDEAQAFFVGVLFVVVIFVLMAPSTSWALRRSYAPHSGYLADTGSERNIMYVDLIPIPPPKPLGPPLSDRIFNEKLVKEFRDRYEEKFGRTEVERVYNSPNRYSYYNDIYGFKGTPQEMDAERQKYGDFVVRRLLEYHVDNYAKNDPKVRPVWEAKERLKEFKVEIATVRLDMNYSIAGNTFDVKLQNPYLSLTRVRLQMNPAVFGPSNVQETTISIGRNVTRTVAMETHYATDDGLLSFIQTKGLSPVLGLSFTEATTTTSQGTTPRGSKYLSGLTYSF